MAIDFDKYRKETEYTFNPNPVQVIDFDKYRKETDEKELTPTVEKEYDKVDSNRFLPQMITPEEHEAKAKESQEAKPLLNATVAGLLPFTTEDDYKYARDVSPSILARDEEKKTIGSDTGFLPKTDITIPEHEGYNTADIARGVGEIGQMATQYGLSSAILPAMTLIKNPIAREIIREGAKDLGVTVTHTIEKLAGGQSLADVKKDILPQIVTDVVINLGFMKIGSFFKSLGYSDAAIKSAEDSFKSAETVTDSAGKSYKFDVKSDTLIPVIKDQDSLFKTGVDSINESVTKTIDDFLEDWSAFNDPRYMYSELGNIVYFCRSDVWNWLHMVGGFFQNNLEMSPNMNFMFNRRGLLNGVQYSQFSVLGGNFNIIRDVHLDGTHVKMVGLSLDDAFVRPLFANGYNRDMTVYPAVKSIENSGEDYRVDLIQADVGYQFGANEKMSVWL